MQREPSKRFWAIHNGFSIFAVLLFCYVGLANHPARPSTVDVIAKLRTALPPQPVSDRCRPVFIYCNDAFRGCGTLITDKSEQAYIVTAAHLFWTDDEGFYSYVDLYDNREKLLPIHEAHPFGDTGADIEICSPGSSQRLKGWRSPEKDQSIFGEGWSFASFNGGSFRSLFSGRTYRMYGRNTGPDEHLPPYCLLTYESIPGESGSGFLSENGGELFVLCGSWPHSFEQKLALADLGVDIPKWQMSSTDGVIYPLP